MELGQGTRQNLNAQRCTLSSIGFSVFSLCLYVLGFYKSPVVNKSSYFLWKPLSPASCVRACTPILPGYIPHSGMVGSSGLSHSLSLFLSLSLSPPLSASFSLSLSLS